MKDLVDCGLAVLGVLAVVVMFGLPILAVYVLAHFILKFW